MIGRAMVALAVPLVALLAVTSSLPSSDRDGRGTFYFANPTIANCESTDGREGYCLFQGCFVNRLSYKGRCGYGLASCCVAEQTCDKTSNANNTYFVNAAYPSPTTSLGSCNITILRRRPNICQLRLDFVEFALEQPDLAGYCQNDVFRVTGGQTKVPEICGDNTGQHMYVEVDPLNYETPIILAVDVKDITLTNRTWNIKVAQIPCSSPEKAPSGCLQYFSGETGSVKSFNYPLSSETVVGEATRQIANTEYSVCVRQESGFCGISWRRDEEDKYAFTLTGNIPTVNQDDIGTPTLRSNDCDDTEKDSVLIPNGVDDEGKRSERNCGLGFPNNVTTSFKPFILHAKTGLLELGDVGNRGFSLTYSQVKC